MSNKDLQTEFVRSYREFSISMALFRNLIGERLGLNITDMECLDVLFFKGIATPTELAEYTGLTTGATTTMLDRLEKSGLISRQPNPNDRRGKLIVINKAAAQEVGAMFGPLRKAQDKLLAEYSAEQLKLLRDYFQRSINIWDQEREKLKQKLKKH